MRIGVSPKNMPWSSLQMRCVRWALFTNPGRRVASFTIRASSFAAITDDGVISTRMYLAEPSTDLGIYRERIQLANTEGACVLHNTLLQYNCLRRVILLHNVVRYGIIM